MSDFSTEGDSILAIQECRKTLGISPGAIVEAREAQFVLRNDLGNYSMVIGNIEVTFRYSGNGRFPFSVDANIRSMGSAFPKRECFSPPKEVFIFDPMARVLLIRGEGFDFGFRFPVVRQLAVKE